MSAIERLRMLASARGNDHAGWYTAEEARAIIAYIDALTAKLAEAERERDAALAEIRQVEAYIEEGRKRHGQHRGDG